MGGSVSGLQSRFGHRAEVGHSGEVRTAEVLDPFCRKYGPTVLHDLAVPIAGMEINIDHIVVSADRVWIIDTKSWKPGIIWTFHGRTRRGLHRFAPAETRTPEIAAKAVSGYLASHRVTHDMRTPILVIWSSSRGKPPSHIMSTRWYRPAGAVTVPGPAFARSLHRHLGALPSNPEIVRALRELVLDNQTDSHPANQPFRSGRTR